MNGTARLLSHRGLWHFELEYEREAPKECSVDSVDCVGYDDHLDE
jgi:hypothetical protein